MDIENKLVVTSGKRKRSRVNSRTMDKKEVIMGLYEIVCVKFLKIVKHYNGDRKWQPTPVLLPGESHGGRSLVGYSPLGRKDSDMTE